MTETTFKFAELSDTAKQTARDRYLSHGLWGDWFDNIYDQAIDAGSCMGIEIDFSSEKSHRTDIEIYFSGFSSQGDGASFQGHYEYKSSAIKVVQENWKDKELIRIATALTTIQITRLLMNAAPMVGSVSVDGRYNHSRSMRFSPEYLINSEGNELDEEHELEVRRLLCDFADWIYRQLETEHDYLTSDEAVDEQLQDSEFDEDGNLV